MKELFVLFLLALLVLPPIIGIRRVRRFLSEHPPEDGSPESPSPSAEHSDEADRRR